MAYTYICEHCKKEFVISRRNRKYCSNTCNGLAFRRKKKICPVCHVKFQPRHNYTIYCSKECFDHFQSGRPNTKLAKKKIYKICKQCGQSFTMIPAHSYRQYCSMECYGQSKIGISTNVGPQNRQWRGGITPQINIERKSGQYECWRKAVFSRDNYTCQHCKKRGNYLHAHHIKPFADYPQLRYEIDNGLTLCRECHLLIHFPKINP